MGMTVYPKQVCWMEVTVPHGLFIQSCYWSNEFLFWEARPLCLRASLVEQAVISFGFPLLLWGRACHSWWNAVARKSSCRHWMEAGSDVFRAACWMLCPQWHKWSWLHEAPVCCRWGQGPRSNTASLCADRQQREIRLYSSPLILKREAEYIFSVCRLKGGWDPCFD